MASATKILYDGFGGVMDSVSNYPSNSDLAGSKFANIVHQYSTRLKLLLDGRPVLFPSQSETALAAVLTAGFRVPGTPTAAAQAIQTGMVSYWLTATVFGQAGPAITAPGAQVLKQTLEITFAAPGLISKSKEIALAIDLFTKTITMPVLIPLFVPIIVPSPVVPSSISGTGYPPLSSESGWTPDDAAGSGASGEGRGDEC